MTRDNGYILITILLAMIILGVLGAYLINQSYLNSDKTKLRIISIQADLFADSLVELLKFNWQHHPNNCPKPSVNFTDAAPQFTGFKYTVNCRKLDYAVEQENDTNKTKSIIKLQVEVTWGNYGQKSYVYTTKQAYLGLN